MFIIILIITFLNFGAPNVCYHIDLYIKKPQKISEGKNQLLIATISPYKAVCTQTTSRRLFHVLSVEGMDTSTITV